MADESPDEVIAHVGEDVLHFPAGTTPDVVQTAVKRYVAARSAAPAPSQPQSEPDVRGAIAARAANPPPNRFGDPNAGKGGGVGDYVGAVASGVQSALPGISLDDPMQSAASMGLQASRDAGNAFAASDTGVARGARIVAAAVPAIGHPVNQLLGPAQAVEANRPPTHQENVDAVAGGAQLGGMMAGGALMKKFGPTEGAAPQPIENAPPPVETPVESGAEHPQAGDVRQVPPIDQSAAPADAPPETAEPEAAAPSPKKASKLPAAVKEFVDGVAPAAASEEANSAANILRKSKAKIDNDATILRYQYKDITNQFEKAGDQANIASISSYERTGKFSNAPDGYSELFTKSMDWAHDALKQVYGDDRVGYVENYVRRAFKFGSEQDADRATSILTNWTRSLSANKSPIKGRVLDMPLDEALQTLRAQGVKVDPVTTNPELLRQWSVENANQALVYKQAWDEAKSSNLIQFVGQDTRIPDGLIPLEDRVAKVFYPGEGGMVKGGQYYADPTVARIFNNAISKGLGGSPTFRAIRAINNAYNQFQLGLSGFHAVVTSINAGLSDLGLGVQQLAQGDVAGGLKSVGRSASFGAYSVARDLYKGRNIVDGLVKDDPQAAEFLRDYLNPAGGRLAIDQNYKNAAYGNMTRAWANNEYIRAAGNAPLAIMQKVAAPLMEYAIPRIKLGAFSDLAEANLAKLPPDASPQMRQNALHQAWTEIDNRFGLLVHDNLFWNKTASDLAHVMTRSVGWNLGTLRALGRPMAGTVAGGIVGGPVGAGVGYAAGLASEIAANGMTPRVLYAAALPIYAGMIGAAYHYLHTGQAPQTPADYYYPQNGLTDNKGRPDRVAIPTYMKDVFSYAKNPVGTVAHKASPLLQLGSDFATNRNYYGDMVRNPEDPAAVQMEQIGLHLLGSALPISVRGTARTIYEGSDPSRALGSFAGFTPAPSEVKKSPEQIQSESDRRRTRPFAPMTPEQREKRNGPLWWLE